MTLSTDDLKTACRLCFLIQLNIRTTACHVGRDRNSAVLTSLRDDLRFHLMELGVQYVVGNPLSAEHLGDVLGNLDRDRADQNGLSLRVGLFDGLYDSFILFLLGLINRVLVILTDDRLIGGDLNDIHAVDLAELSLLSERRTGHTALLVKFIEEVLERNGGERLALLLDLYVFLCFDRLVKSVAVASSGHYTARKLINDQDLVIFDDIIVVLVHQVIGAQGQNDAVLDLQVFRIRQVGDVEEFLDLGDAFSGQVDHLVLLIDDEVAGLFSFNAHDRVDLGQVLHIFAALHLLGQNIACLVDLGGLSALSGNDQRSTGFVDEDRVDLVDDRIVKFTKNQLFLIDGHVITKIVKAEFVVGDIGDVTAVLFLSLLAAHAVEDYTDSQPHKCVDLSHPLRVTLCQVIVDCDDMYASAFKCIEISRHGGDQCLTFTGTHLGDTSLVQDDRADQLYAERLHSKRSSGAFSDCRIGFGKNVVECLAFIQSLLKFICLGTQLIVAQCDHLRAEALDLFYDRIDPSQFSLAVCAEKHISNLGHIYILPIVLSISHIL